MNGITLFFGLLIVAFSQLTFAQGTSLADTVIAKQHYAAGDSLMKRANYADAIVAYQRAASIYEDIPIWKKYLRTYNRIIEGEWRLGQYDLAIREAETVIELSAELLGDRKLAQVSAYSNLAIIFYLKGNYDTALQRLYEAVSIQKEILGEDHVDLSHSYGTIASIYDKKNEIDSALSYHKRSLHIRIKQLGENHLYISHSYNNLGSLYHKIGSFDLALDYYNRSLKIRVQQKVPPISLATVYSNIGRIHRTMGATDLALKFYSKALEIWQKKLGKEHPRVAWLYSLMSAAYIDMGAYVQAQELGKNVLSILEANPNNEKPVLANSYDVVAATYQKTNDYLSALIYYEKALKLREEQLGPTHGAVATSYNNIGSIYALQNKYNLALEYHNNALKIRINTFGENHQSVAMSYNNISNVHKDKGTLEAAEYFQKKSIAIRQSIMGNKSHELAQSYNSLGDIYFQKKDYSSSLTYYQQALIANLPEFADSDINSNPDSVENCLNYIFLLESFKNKAMAFEKKASMNDNDSKDLQFALSTLKLCDLIIDKIRSSFLNYNDKVNLGQVSTEIYEHGMRMSLNLFRGSINKTYLDTAYYFAEKNKASVLIESINSIAARKMKLLPDSLIILEQRIKVDRSFYRSKVQELKVKKNGYDTTKYNLYNGALFQRNRQYDSLILALEQNYPRYHKLKYRNDIININSIQNRLSDNTAVVEYCEVDSTLYAFVITNKKSEVFDLPKVSDYEDIISELRGQMTSSADSTRFTTYVTSATALYNLFLSEPIEFIKENDQIEHLLIVPDGKLSYVPFELLIGSNKGVENSDYASLNYLINDYAVSYAYSSTLYFEKIDMPNVNPSNGFLGYAPSYQIETTSALELGKFRDALVDLEWNQQETELIAVRLNGDYFLSENATETSFKNRIKDYKVVHLAMHALVDDEDPMNSKLVFYQDNDSIQDGYLYTHELIDMEMSSELVVLSACNTGYGKLAEGEGVVSLAYGFSYAGCPSIVMSQWLVNDFTTNDIMINFYKYLEEGYSKDQALRVAKLDFIKNADNKTSHPKYWAPFVLVGNSDPVSFYNPNHMVYLIVLFGVLLLVGLFFVMRKRLSF